MYIVLRLLVAEDGSDCPNTDVVLGVADTYEKAIEYAIPYIHGFCDHNIGFDASPSAIEVFSVSYHGAYTEKISIYKLFDTTMDCDLCKRASVQRGFICRKCRESGCIACRKLICPFCKERL